MIIPAETIKLKDMKEYLPECHNIAHRQALPVEICRP